MRTHPLLIGAVPTPRANPETAFSSSRTGMSAMINTAHRDFLMSNVHNSHESHSPSVMCEMDTQLFARREGPHLACIMRLISRILIIVCSSGYIFLSRTPEEGRLPARRSSSTPTPSSLLIGAGHPFCYSLITKYPMPQISEHPPPYVHDWSSFPPPLLVDAGYRAWAFQLAFENAREIVKWTILQTFELWIDEWAFKGNKIYRQNLQQAYDGAPEELKQAVDWQLKLDTPVIMLSDQTRRWHEHVRLKEAGIHEDILPSSKFEAEFDAASPSRQQAVLFTVSAWKRYNESVTVEPPQRDTLTNVYENASSSLKLALCFVLEMGLTYPIQRMQSIDERKADLYMFVASHRANVPYWEAHAKAAGLW